MNYHWWLGKTVIISHPVAWHLGNINLSTKCSWWKAPHTTARKGYIYIPPFNLRIIRATLVSAFMQLFAYLQSIFAILSRRSPMRSIHLQDMHTFHLPDEIGSRFNKLKYLKWGFPYKILLTFTNHLHPSLPLPHFNIFQPSPHGPRYDWASWWPPCRCCWRAAGTAKQPLRAPNRRRGAWGWRGWPGQGHGWRGCKNAIKNAIKNGWDFEIRENQNWHPSFLHGFAIKYCVLFAWTNFPELLFFVYVLSKDPWFFSKIHVDRFQSPLVNALKQSLQVCVVAPGLLYSKQPTKQQTHHREKHAVERSSVDQQQAPKQEKTTAFLPGSQEFAYSS